MDYKNSTSLDEIFPTLFDDREKLKDFLNTVFYEYLNDGNFEVFYHCLELVIKSQDTMCGFANKINLSKVSLYNIVQGKKEPKITTLAKILKQLDLTLKIA